MGNRDLEKSARVIAALREEEGEEALPEGQGCLAKCLVWKFPFERVKFEFHLVFLFKRRCIANANLTFKCFCRKG